MSSKGGSLVRCLLGTLLVYMREKREPEKEQLPTLYIEQCCHNSGREGEVKPTSRGGKGRQKLSIFIIGLSEECIRCCKVSEKYKYFTVSWSFSIVGFEQNYHDFCEKTNSLLCSPWKLPLLSIFSLRRWFCSSFCPSRACKRNETKMILCWIDVIVRYRLSDRRVYL